MRCFGGMEHISYYYAEGIDVAVMINYSVDSFPALIRSRHVFLEICRELAKAF